MRHRLQNRRRPRTWVPIVAVSAGVLLAVGTPVGWSVTDHPTGIRQVRPGTVVELANPVGRPQPSGPTVRSPTHRTARPGPRTRSARRTAPVRITIPAQAIDAPVRPEGVTARGEMAIPERISTVGWYRWGAAPGARSGSIVVVGHVDSATQGLGAFFRLRSITAGVTVSVTTADHRVWRYRVIAREQFRKSAEPLTDIFARTGRPRLTLVTCGGTFDRRTLSYRDNVVVTAIPTGGPEQTHY